MLEELQRAENLVWLDTELGLYTPSIAQGKTRSAMCIRQLYPKHVNGYNGYAIQAHTPVFMCI